MEILTKAALSFAHTMPRRVGRLRGFLSALLATPLLLALACGSSGKSGPDGQATSGSSSSAGSAGQSTVTDGGAVMTAGATSGGLGTGGGSAGSDAGTGAGTDAGGKPGEPPRDPFDVVTDGVAADIYVDAADQAAVVRATTDLQADVKRVSGASPTIKNTLAGLSSRAILVGTLGHSAAIDDLVSQGKLDTASIAGKWESFVIQAVNDPAPGISRALVIAGSDRRGTIYGIYDVSQAMGVSPWYWWADVTPTPATTVTVEGARRLQGEPSVKYRGIFLNDEENFSTWSALKMDAGKHAGPETYKRVFELLLRLKANFLWPAMHAVSDEFNHYPENAKNADLYGIVMGSSHPEMLLRNNVKEWDPWAKAHGNPAYDYSVNPKALHDYWEDRVKQNGKFENGYSVGMRGIHDSGLVAANASSTAQKVALMQDIFADQRGILTTNVNPDLTKIFQVFTPYKEVLTLYNAGLKVPDDVTILWAEDNHGYLRQIPNDAERKRSGGAGVYYHISYYGDPQSYLWINTTPLTLVREELRKAYDAGANRLWVINVGDLKPSEIALELAMRLAWRVDDVTESNVADNVASLARRDFDAKTAQEVAAIVMRYYQINIARRPEFMKKGVYDQVNYGDEGQQRLDELTDLLARATAVSDGLPAIKKDAFYEMVLYPLRASQLTMQMYVAATKTDLFARQGRTASVTRYRKLATDAYQTIQSDLKYYNETLAGGKWQRIMNPYNSAIPVIAGLPALAAAPASSASALGVAVEGQTTGSEPADLELSVYTQDQRFVDIFTKGDAGFSWTATPSVSWIQVSKSSGTLSDEERIQVSVDWKSVPVGASTGTLTIAGASSSKAITIHASNPMTPRPEEVDGYVEANGYVAIEAEHFHDRMSRGGAEWKVLTQLGRSGDSVKVFPDVSPSVTSDYANTAAQLDYKIYFFSTGTFPITVFRIPTLNTTGSCRLALGLDSSAAQTLKGADSTDDAAWSNNVIEHIEKLSGTIQVTTPGYHTLHVWKVDPSIAIDRIVIDTGKLKPSYLGPPESYHH